MNALRHRFFQITSGPFVDRLMEIRQKRIDAGVAIKAFMADVGASQCYGTSPATYLFDFDHADKVDMQAWAKTKPRRGEYFFKPRRGTAAGKVIAERIKHLPESPPVDDALALTGLDYRFPVVLEGDRGYRPYIRFWSVAAPLVIVVSVPWRDYPEKELAQYRKDRKAGKHMSSALDQALWVAPDWMVELKEWEALKLIEERQVKAGATA